MPTTTLTSGDDVFAFDPRADADIAEDDTIFGGPSTDLTVTGTGVDINVSADGTGNDSLVGTLGDDVIYAGDGNDTITSSFATDFPRLRQPFLDGGDPVPVELQSGGDTIYGGAGDDLVTTQGPAGIESNIPDTVFGGDGNDSIVGAITQAAPDARTDVLYGGAGNDTIDGNTGDDLIYGGGGDDLVFARAGSDTTDGGEGFDTINFSRDEGAVDFDMASGATTVTLSGATATVESNINYDNVVGSSGNDTLTGSDENNTIDGGAGDDSINAGGGDDFIILGDIPGNDTIIGGETGETPQDSANDVFEGDTLSINRPAGGRFDVLYGGPGGAPSEAGVVNIIDSSGITVSTVTFSEIENIVCFAEGTLIDTPTGAVAIETLQEGDLVLTRDNGPQPLRWIGRQTVVTRGKMAPVVIKAGALENDRDLRVSQLHRMLVTDWRVAVMFDEPEVLVTAKHLVNGETIYLEESPCARITYFHMLFDCHQIVTANGTPAESFHPGDQGMGWLADECREEIFEVFPHLRVAIGGYGSTARTSLRAFEARALNR